MSKNVKVVNFLPDFRCDENPPGGHMGDSKMCWVQTLDICN